MIQFIKWLDSVIVSGYLSTTVYAMSYDDDKTSETFDTKIAFWLLEVIGVKIIFEVFTELEIYFDWRE